jgi:hypothetical protein
MGARMVFAAYSAPFTLPFSKVHAAIHFLGSPKILFAVIALFILAAARKSRRI